MDSLKHYHTDKQFKNHELRVQRQYVNKGHLETRLQDFIDVFLACIFVWTVQGQGMLFWLMCLNQPQSQYPIRDWGSDLASLHPHVMNACLYVRLSSFLPVHIYNLLPLQLATHKDLLPTSEHVSFVLSILCLVWSSDSLSSLIIMLKFLLIHLYPYSKVNCLSQVFFLFCTINFVTH